MSHSGTTTPHPHRPHLPRLRHFSLPSGRSVHIALSPEEASTLRSKLLASNPDVPFDLVISGSPEHLDALKEAHSHHEERKRLLREKHGGDFEEWEKVREQLDGLGKEMHMLTDHGAAVALDANFSKYGYSAHLRTYEDSSTSSASSVSNFHGDAEHVNKDWEAERRNGRIMKIYKKPTIRQYFHKGLLWRSPEAREVASFELFVDLLYVGIIAINGDHAAENAIGYEVLRFSITFIMSWKLWSDISIVVSWLETDDIVQRVSVMFIMVCLLGFTTNMLNVFESTYAQLIAFYLAARMFLGCYYFILAWLIPMVRGMMTMQGIITAIPCAIWIASIYVSMPNRLALIWTALFLDLCASMVVIMFIRWPKTSEWLKKWTERVFEFYPATNIEHKIERTNAFVTLVFGYTVVAIIYQNAASFGLNSFFGKAALGLIQAFCFNWIYFELDNDIQNIFQHAIRRSAFSAVAWSSAHLPFIMGFVMASAALSRLVLTTDCPDANMDTLTQSYMLRSEHEVPIGLRWYYCAGFALALFCMGIISLTHIHKTASCRLPKPYRLFNRAVVCVILLCLPAAESLNSLSLISIVTALVVWVLVLELWATSCPTESFFGEKTKCNYTAQCKVKRGDLETAMKTGKLIDIEDVKEKEGGVYNKIMI